MNDENIAKIEAAYSAKYVGYYDLPDREGPFWVFYVAEPDTSKGHSNYFGMFFAPFTGELYITNAGSLVDAKFPAIFHNGKYLVSRYHHDYQTSGSAMIDGGLAYTRINPQYPITHTMTVDDGVEIFKDKNCE